MSVEIHHQHAIEKADVLIEALGWIRRFRDKVTVIKLGGSVMEDENDAAASAARHRVHGNGRHAAGRRPRRRRGDQSGDGLRRSSRGSFRGAATPTTPRWRSLNKSLAYETNEHIAKRIEEFGGRAMPLNFRTTNVLFGERITLTDDAGKDVDLGHVGTVTRVDRTTIENLCYAGQVPVIPSMCLGPDGEKLNVNADTAATAVATALGAEKLIFLSDVNGVRKQKDDPKTLLNSLTAAQARKLISDGAIESGMIPKVEGCLETLDKGVRKIHIIDGRLRHSLLLEIYTNKGVGTEMMRDD